jgi:simple sugar transport system ATP-binding protein
MPQATVRGPAEAFVTSPDPQPEAGAAPIVLETRSVTMHFGGVAALSHGDFQLREGEVHAIVGDNGAGKSTLLKIIAGAHRPDNGELLINGQPVTLANPRAAQELGVATVFQDLGLIDHLDAAANLFLGREIHRRAPLSWLGVLDKKEMRKRAAREVVRLKVNIGSVSQMLGGMSGGQRQAIAVARAAAFGTRIILMDEPTAALGVRETAAVCDLIRQLSDEGMSVAIVSHSMPDVFAVSERITVLRHGRTVKTVRTAECSTEEIVGMMTGAFESSILPENRRQATERA